MYLGFHELAETALSCGGSNRRGDYVLPFPTTLTVQRAFLTPSMSINVFNIV